MKTLNYQLTAFLKEKGASIIGFADLREIDSGARDGFPYGISIAVALNPQIIAGIEDGPNLPYFKEYQRANHLLDTLGDLTARFLEQRGHKASNFAATNVGIDPQTFSTRLPHKTVATRAGLGWVGKSNLLITEEYGSAVRLVTVLTDAPLAIGKAINSSECGDCTACVDICPAHAHTGRNWQPGLPRDSIVDVFACRETAHEFEKVRKGVSDSICGMCIVACPWTKKYLEKAVKI